MDKFKFESIRERLKLKLGKSSENEGVESSKYIKLGNGGVKRKFDSMNEDKVLNKINSESNKSSKTFNIKVKEIITKPKVAEPASEENLDEQLSPDKAGDSVDNEDIVKSNSISFDHLHKNVRTVKLPAKNWKIKMFMTEKMKPLKIVFTNKSEHERCVSFSYCSDDFVITFSGYTVNLLAAPKIVTSIEDISTLLNIIDKISETDLFLEYL